MPSGQRRSGSRAAYRASLPEYAIASLDRGRLSRFRLPTTKRRSLIGHPSCFEVTTSGTECPSPRPSDAAAPADRGRIRALSRPNTATTVRQSEEQPMFVVSGLAIVWNHQPVFSFARVGYFSISASALHVLPPKSTICERMNVVAGPSLPAGKLRKTDPSFCQLPSLHMTKPHGDLCQRIASRSRPVFISSNTPLAKRFGSRVGERGRSRTPSTARLNWTEPRVATSPCLKHAQAALFGPASRISKQR